MKPESGIPRLAIRLTWPVHFVERIRESHFHFSDEMHEKGTPMFHKKNLADGGKFRKLTPAQLDALARQACMRAV